MPRIPAQCVLALVSLAVLPSALGQEAKPPVKTVRLDSLSGLETINVKAEVVDYRGRRAVRLLPTGDAAAASTKETIAILEGTSLKDGTIEVEVAGAPRAGAPEGARGFIGIAFRVAARGASYESFYLRPTNGRADDQVRRNHSTQYISFPDYPWERLRKESPGVYESYVDLDAGAWTKLKIVVAGTKGRLYVNGADQPCLIVNDLKLGERGGQIALWTESTTDGYFSNLTVK